MEPQGGSASDPSGAPAAAPQVGASASSSQRRQDLSGASVSAQQSSVAVGSGTGANHNEQQLHSATVAAAGTLVSTELATANVGHNERVDCSLSGANNNNNNADDDDAGDNSSQDLGANNNNTRNNGAVSVRAKDNGGSRNRRQRSSTTNTNEQDRREQDEGQRQAAASFLSQRQPIVAEGRAPSPLDGAGRGLGALAGGGGGGGDGDSPTSSAPSSSSGGRSADRWVASEATVSVQRQARAAAAAVANNYNTRAASVGSSSSSSHVKSSAACAAAHITPTRPLILITDPNSNSASHKFSTHEEADEEFSEDNDNDNEHGDAHERPREAIGPAAGSALAMDTAAGFAGAPSAPTNQQVSFGARDESAGANSVNSGLESEQYEEIDGIQYRIVAAVTKPLAGGRLPRSTNQTEDNQHQQQQQQGQHNGGKKEGKLNSMRRKSSAFVSNLLQSTFLGPQSSLSSHELADGTGNAGASPKPRRLSIYEMTKSPPPETSLEIYLNERRRSSTVSSKQAQAQITEQKSTFETNYCARQQYFKDLNAKLINQDKKLLNVVANRGQIHRHSVDIAQLPLHLAQAKAAKSSTTSSSARNSRRVAANGRLNSSAALEANAEAANRAANFAPDGSEESPAAGFEDKSNSSLAANINHQQPPIVRQDQSFGLEREDGFDQLPAQNSSLPLPAANRLEAIKETTAAPQPITTTTTSGQRGSLLLDARGERKRSSTSSRGLPSDHLRGHRKSRVFVRRFKKLDQSVLSSTPAPDVKIGQRVAYKEYYGNEFGTIRWIGRVPQICPDWTVGVEFDNAIGEGDGSLNGRRYFLAKDCFAKFLPLERVNLVDQHVGRPEPGTMISVMSAAVRPGQMISIQRVSTVHVQHCFLNAPHRKPGADILAVNTRLHCQCPNCGPCAHVIKPPRTERLVGSGKNATHMCQFSTYTCCGMESSEEAMCTYTGNKISSLPPPMGLSALGGGGGLPPVGNSWIEGAGYLTNLQAQQSKLMPEEYRFGAAPEDINPLTRRLSTRSSSSRRGSGKHHGRSNPGASSTTPRASPIGSSASRACSCCPPATTATNFMPQPPPPSQPPPSYTPPESHFASQLQASKMEDHAPISGEPELPKLLDDSDNDDEGNYAKPKGQQQKIVYRDSIENRYLFPTDEPVDSTLEADLEDLSQARYGHCTDSRAHSSRGLLKSLRSLVSCLSSSNRSEIDQYSDRTYRYNGQASNDINKSLPTMMMASAVDEDFPSGNFSDDLQKDDLSKQDLQSAASFLMSYSSPNGKDEFPVPPYRAPGQVAAATTTTTTTTATRHVSGSSDCGFSSASMNSANISGGSPLGSSLDEEKRMNQVYRHIVNRLLNSPAITGDDLLRLRKALFTDPYGQTAPQQLGGSCCLHAAASEQVYQNTASLVNAKNGSDQIVSELIRKANLTQGGEWCEQMIGAPDQRISGESCCAATSTTNQWFYDEQQQFVSSSMDYQQQHCKHQGQSHRGHHGKQPAAPKSIAGSSSTTESMTLSSQSECSYTNASEAKTEPIRPATAATRLDDSGSKSVTVANSVLPKAFELKLTLSINNNNNSERKLEQSAGEQQPVANLVMDLDEASGGPKAQSLAGSTLNINIVSSQPKEETDRNEQVAADQA